MINNVQRPLNTVVSRRARENALRRTAEAIFTKEAKASAGTDAQKIAAAWMKQQGETDEQNYTA